MKYLFTILTLALIPACAFSTDGVVLINQSTVMAAGGFPYSIAQPGSYRLSGNLMVPSGMSAIVISVSNVTVDLNGFSITAAELQTVVPTYGITTPSSPAISGIAIRNGAIRGFVHPVQPQYAAGSAGTGAWALEDLLLENGFGGVPTMTLGSFSRISHITAPDTSIDLTCPSVVTDSAALRISVAGGSGTCSVSNNATLF
jgi:hypothetical protein